MGNGIEIDGFDELEELVQDMTITEQDEKKAMKKALVPATREVESNTPEKTKKLKKSLKEIVKKEDLATVGIIRFGRFWDVFQEFGTSNEKKHVGFFERSINKAQNEVVKILAEELLK